MKRKIGINNMEMTRTWVDASYATHPDMRSHTGGCYSLGIGIAHHKSSKQKLNKRSFTEAVLVEASDYIAYTLWMMRFLRHQGYHIKLHIFYQDNESAIKMEKNGVGSTSDKSRHINIRYFFIKDTIKRQKITVKHCPT